jgi:hypothetical protein
LSLCDDDQLGYQNQIPYLLAYFVWLMSMHLWANNLAVFSGFLCCSGIYDRT